MLLGCLHVRLFSLFLLLSSLPLSLIGSGFVWIDYDRYSTHHFWNEKGERLSTYNQFRRHQVDLYGQYSWNCRDFLSLRASYSEIRESLNGNTSGIGDLELGWKRLLYCNAPHYVAAQAVAVIPPAKYKPALRYGQFGGELNLPSSHWFQLQGKPGVCSLRLGYRGYTGFPSDQIRADALLSYCPSPLLQLSIGSHLEYGLFNGKSRLDASNVAFNPNYRLWLLQFTGLFPLWKSSYIAAGYTKPVWGRNVGTGGSYFGGVNVLF